MALVGRIRKKRESCSLHLAPHVRKQSCSKAVEKGIQAYNDLLVVCILRELLPLSLSLSKPCPERTELLRAYQGGSGGRQCRWLPALCCTHRITRRIPPRLPLSCSHTQSQLVRAAAFCSGVQQAEVPHQHCPLFTSPRPSLATTPAQL